MCEEIQVIYKGTHHSKRNDLNSYHSQGPTQVKCWLLISSIFDAMNFKHFLEKLEIHCIEIKSRHLT